MLHGLKLLDLRRQSVADRHIARILREMQAVELARSAGLCLKHNCNHVGRVDGFDWDQAVLCCTRYLPMTEPAAEAIRLAAEQARVSFRRPDTATHRHYGRTRLRPCHLHGTYAFALTFGQDQTR